MNQVKKAVFPVAGLGTRFLPATKANPKEMLPIVDKPLIQYAVEEAVDAGITEIIFVTSSSKRAIEDHFDSNFELESTLSERGKDDMLKMVRDILPKGVTCSYVRQAEQLGLGHAVLCAKPLVNHEPFAVLLADDLIDGNGVGCIKQMVNSFNSNGASVVAVEEIEPDQTERYGVVALEQGSNKMTQIVEKPKPAEAPSNLAVVGRYILTPAIFELLENTQRGAGNEIQLTDAIAALIDLEEVYVHHFDGVRYDCGSKLGYLHATMAYAIKHPELADRFKPLLRKLAKEHEVV